MFSSLRKTILIIFLAIIALYISLPKEIPIKFKLGSLNVDTKFTRYDPNLKLGRITIKNNFDLVLGLDLAGGSHLVFEADTKSLASADKKEAILSLKEVMEKRVNLFGVSEPNVQTSSFEGKDRIIVELPGVKDTKQAVDLIGKVAQLVFVETGNEGDTGLKPTDLTGADLKKASVSFDTSTGKPVVSLEFTEEGGKKFADITERNVGKTLAIFLDSEPISAPVVREKITGGKAQISGDFTVEAVKNLVVQLNAGALPVPVKLVEERTIGATLGGESIEKSITAGLIGLTMVLIFMVLTYGRFGIIADFALIIFGVLTFAIYKLIPVVLTLPGIAGFLLSVGMSVDSNILIFERFKEEKDKHQLIDALEVSFGKAWDSIRDANLATLSTAFILANPLDLNFLHTSGPVRGFAITLALGILISLFTGIVVTRNLLRVFVKEKKE